MTRTLSSEFNEVYQILRADIDAICKPEVDLGNKAFHYSDPSNLSQSQRRALVRAVFAFAEATTFFMRQVLLADYAAQLPAPTILALQERQIAVTSAGQVRTNPLRVSAMSLIRLMIDTYHQILPLSKSVQCKGHSFEALAASVVVRDRLMHPKAAAQLLVSEEETRSVLAGFVWLNETTRRLLELHVAALQSRNATLRSVAAHLRKGEL